jgi:membrane protease YdiL (CAAX protease family)
MSALAIVGVCVMLMLDIAFGWYILVPSQQLRLIERATAHLVQPTLVLNATTGAFVALVARSTLRDLGLDRGLVRGLVVLVTGYATIQVGLATAAGELVPGRALTAPAGVVIRSVIAQVVGTALVEESVFRGLVFRQLALRMHVALAAALSAFLFAIWHVRQRQSLGLLGARPRREHRDRLARRRLRGVTLPAHQEPLHRDCPARAVQRGRTAGRFAGLAPGHPLDLRARPHPLDVVRQSTG